MTKGWGYLLLTSLACDNDRDCVQLDATCSPLYEPTFDNVYEQTLVQSCGVGGGSCHSAEGGQGGMVFADPDDSWEMLTEDLGEISWVIPGDASCSPLIQVLHSEDPALLMPPGNPLSDAELCAIEQWIDAGAER